MSHDAFHAFFLYLQSLSSTIELLKKEVQLQVKKQQRAFEMKEHLESSRSEALKLKAQLAPVSTFPLCLATPCFPLPLSITYLLIFGNAIADVATSLPQIYVLILTIAILPC